MAQPWTKHTHNSLKTLVTNPDSLRDDYWSTETTGLCWNNDITGREKWPCKERRAKGLKSVCGVGVWEWIDPQKTSPYGVGQGNSWFMSGLFRFCAARESGILQAGEVKEFESAKTDSIKILRMSLIWLHQTHTMTDTKGHFVLYLLCKNWGVATISHWTSNHLEHLLCEMVCMKAMFCPSSSH